MSAISKLKKEIENYKAGISMCEWRFENWGNDYPAYEQDVEFYNKEKQGLEVAKQQLKHEMHNYRIYLKNRNK